MKTNNIYIKIAEPEDALAWANMLLSLDEEVEFTTFEPGERSLDVKKYQAKIAETKNNPNAVVLLAIDNHLKENNVIGYVCAEAYKNQRKKHVATVGLGILQSYYSRGIAHLLIIELMKYAKNSGVKRVEAHIAENNPKSIHLAQKFGFLLEGIKKNALKINDNYLDEYLLTLEVKDYD